MEDTNIIRLLWARSEQALTLLAKKFGALLHRLAMGITNRYDVPLFAGVVNAP